VSGQEKHVTIFHVANHYHVQDKLDWSSIRGLVFNQRNMILAGLGHLWIELGLLKVYSRKISPNDTVRVVNASSHQSSCCIGFQIFLSSPLPQSCINQATIFVGQKIPPDFSKNRNAPQSSKMDVIELVSTVAPLKTIFSTLRLILFLTTLSVSDPSAHHPAKWHCSSKVPTVMNKTKTRERSKSLWKATAWGVSFDRVDLGCQFQGVLMNLRGGMPLVDGVPKTYWEIAIDVLSRPPLIIAHETAARKREAEALERELVQLR
jgi:hypothetical protein